jgi:choice-of-anchor C domain-containing protein
MQVSRRILVVLLALCTVVSFGSAALAGARTNLVKNGGFERPNISGDFETFDDGDEISDQDEWIVDSGSVDLVSGRFDAFRGDQAIDLNGDEAGSIVQEIEGTEDGEDYLLRFHLAGNPECADKVKVLNVWWDGELVATFYYDTTGQTAGNLNWQLRALELHADEDDVELQFESDNTGFCGPMIDAVSVREIVG